MGLSVRRRNFDGRVISGGRKSLTVIWFNLKFEVTEVLTILGSRSEFERYYPTSTEIPSSLPGWGFRRILGFNYREGGVDLMAVATYNPSQSFHGEYNIYFFHFSDEVIDL
ncbi:MAG: hypothetical protein D6732_23960 [Methanobacteriota archaeon]|nr:MAG: hypothetical protein D6732_23960 [Euryarchaeota archaeon]